MADWQLITGNTRKPPQTIWIIAIIVAIIALIPALYTIIRAIEAIGTTPLPPWPLLSRLIVNTILLAVCSAGVAGVIGVIQALLIERTDVVGRRFWRIIVALPLAIPPYVLSITTIALLRPRGIFERWLEERSVVEFGELPFNSIFGLPGSTLVIALCLSPYVYLPVAAVLRQGSNHLSEIAQISGASWHYRLRHVTLPLIAPAAGGGMLLVMLYALADFGVPALLRLPTFSTAIYGRFTGQIDRAGAAMLSLPLIIATLGLIILEERLAGRGGAQINRSWRPQLPHALGGWQLPVLLGLIGISTAALIGPIATLIYWSTNVVSASEIASRVPLDRLLGIGFGNIAFVAGVATLTTALAVTPALLLRRGGIVGVVLARISQAGYALPGVVVALSIVLVINQGAPWLAGGLIPLVLAYIIRFLPQAVQSLDAAFEQIAPSLEEAGRSLGQTANNVIRQIVLPLAAPGLQASWALLFLSMLKELPATLLLRPAGFDTLAVRIWMPASDGLYTAAAIPALILLVGALLPLALVLRNQYQRPSYTPPPEE
jgi:iron(III) transport system permease protein